MVRGWVVSGWVAACVGCGSAASKAPPVEGACDESGFADPALAAAVRAQLGVSEDDEIDPNALAAVTMLMIDDVGITDLSGIECAVSLEYLFARDNQITDVAPLAALDVIEHVHVDGNEIVDLSPLSGHPNLFNLRAPNNLVTTVANVVDIPRLANLDVSDNPVSDLGQFSGLQQLVSLRIERTRVADLSALANLPRLDNVYVAGAALTSLASLPSLGKLTSLHAADNTIVDATCTASLPSLRELDLAGNQLTSAEGLSFETLRNGPLLVLDGNPLQGLQSLERLALRRLSINEVGIADLTSLASIDGPLVGLSARSNGIVDVTPITNIPSLDLADNAIADLGPFIGQGIGYLDVSNNAIVDVSPLLEIDFVSCGTVSLAGNPLQDEATVVDTLCDRNIVVTGECLPLACDPCAGSEEECG
jgi:Leucine-rich repeat (LRR) protein